MRRQKLINGQRQRRQNRVRKSVRGTTDRPRLTVFRGHRNITCQVIDDSLGITLVSASSQEKALRDDIKYGGNQSVAQKIGQIVAERAVEKGIKAVCFDRGHYRFHGRIAALANAAREAGLSF